MSSDISDSFQNWTYTFVETIQNLNSMKKNFFMIALFAIALVFNACSNDDNEDTTVIAYENLPAESKQFITDHFAGYEITKTVQLSSRYAVSLNKTVAKNTIAYGSYEVEFDRQGVWLEIEGRNDAALPDNVLALIPRSILSYINQNYPTRDITEIKKETYGYQIDLTGKLDVELKFDYNGNLLAVDNDEDGVVIEFGKLPESAQAFLNTHFSGLTPTKIEKDNDGYEVEYADKTDVEFDLLGSWYKVEVEKGEVPQSVLTLLPQKLLDYISSTHPSKKIESVKNKVSVYDVELYGDIDLVFDKEGNLWNSSNNNSSNGHGERLQYSSLPQSVQSFLAEHFLTTTTFLYAEQEDNEYEVKLANGTQVEFYFDGSLKSVEVLPGNSVPDSVVKSEVLSYVKANYADKRIEEYEKKTIGYKVELSGYPKLELIFDSNGNFKGLDK